MSSTVCPEIPNQGQAASPKIIISSVTFLATLEETEKPNPWAPSMIAVFIPITLPLRSINGPPLLPGLIAASVCTNPTINLPVLTSIERSTALTTPTVTECESPKGFPIAITFWPTLISLESAHFI